jgi:hypothetical protein
MSISNIIGTGDYPNKCCISCDYYDSENICHFWKVETPTDAYCLWFESENDKDYIEIAQKRIGEYKGQLKLTV